MGTDGGPAAKELAPKFSVLKDQLSSKLGFAIPDVDVRLFIMSISAVSCISFCYVALVCCVYDVGLLYAA